MRKIPFIIICFCILVIIFIPPAMAEVGGGCAEDDEGLINPIDACTFEGLVSAIAKWFRAIMIPISAIMVLYAGALFMTAAGEQERIAKAKRALLWAFVGVGIVLISTGIIETVKSFLNLGS